MNQGKYTGSVSPVCRPYKKGTFREGEIKKERTALYFLLPVLIVLSTFRPRQKEAGQGENV